MAAHDDPTGPSEARQSPLPNDSGFRAFQPDEVAQRQRQKSPDRDASAADTSPPDQRAASARRSSSVSPPHPAAQAAAGDAPRFPRWRNTDRAKRWQKLPEPDVARLQIAQLATFLAVPLVPLGLHGLWFVITYFWSRFATSVLYLSMGIPTYHFPVPGLFYGFANWANGMQPLPFALLSLTHILDVLVLLGLTFFGAPYFLGFVLKHVYQMQPLSIGRLGQVSPEAQRRIQAYSQQLHQPLPQLGLLPATAPIAFTYGTVAKNSCIVLSQGLLDQLNEAEIATICSGEVRYIHPLNAGLMTWIMAVLQAPYLLYRLSADAADQLSAFASNQTYRIVSILLWIGVYLLAIVAAIAYIAFDLLRWIGLWFSRQRSVVADYMAANLTGNPNAHARALLKLAYGLSQTLQAKRQTDFVLEAFELGMPIGYRQAMTVGSLLGIIPVESALAWDWANGQQYYLSFNNSHALLGDRLFRLMQYAQQWQLSQELDMQLCVDQQAARCQPKWLQLFVAGLPFWCAAIGYGLAVSLWVIAWLGFWLGFQQIAWLGSDWRLMYALPVIGFGIGTLFRFNRYFPDLPRSWQRRPPETVDRLAVIVQDPQALPNQANPTALTGYLMGRQGVSNWLCQDLFLQSRRVLVRLHYPSYLGWLSNLLWVENRATDLLGQTVSAIGWLRRGATPWMDVERLQNQSGQARRGGHQVWSVIVGLMAILIGLMWLGMAEDLTAVLQRVEGVRR